MKIDLRLTPKEVKKESIYLKEFKNFVNEQFKELFKKKLRFPVTVYHL